MQETGLHVDLDALVQDLPVGDRQRLEILKALYRGARILILDEPTAVLTPQETDALFDTLRGLRARGTTVLLITHKLKEIMALCDAVTVMRGGQVVLDCPSPAPRWTAWPKPWWAGASTWAVTASRHARCGAAAGPGPGLDRQPGRAAAGDVSLTLRAGEIVGVAGVSGNGQSELLDVLSGLLAPHQGSLVVGSARFGPHDWLDTRTARELRIAHVPEDRHRRGLVLPFDAWESAVLGYQSRPRYSLAGWMRQRHMRDDCAAMMERYDVRPRNPALRSSKFSGGQPAEAGAGARSVARAAGAAGGPADARAWTSAPSSSSTAGCAPCATPAARCWWCRRNWTRSWR
jgi:ABC-type uncharacterized transport system ATPase subunit